jgi:hypothetical protein
LEQEAVGARNGHRRPRLYTVSDRLGRPGDLSQQRRRHLDEPSHPKLLDALQEVVEVRQESSARVAFGQAWAAYNASCQWWTPWPRLGQPGRRRTTFGRGRRVVSHDRKASAWGPRRTRWPRAAGGAGQDRRRQPRVSPAARAPHQGDRPHDRQSSAASGWVRAQDQARPGAREGNESVVCQTIESAPFVSGGLDGRG